MIDKIARKYTGVTTILASDMDTNTTTYTSDLQLWRYPEGELHDTQLSLEEYNSKELEYNNCWIVNAKTEQGYTLIVLHSPSRIKHIVGAINMYGPFRFEHVYSEDGTPRSRISSRSVDAIE